MTATDMLSPAQLQREKISAGEATFTYEKNQPCACQVSFPHVPQPQPPISLN